MVPNESLPRLIKYKKKKKTYFIIFGPNLKIFIISFKNLKTKRISLLSLIQNLHFSKKKIEKTLKI